MKVSLLQRFIKTVEARPEDVFLTLGESGQSYTFKQFYKDVLGVGYFLDSTYSDVTVVVLMGSNTYEFAVYSLATILSGKILFPLNWNEDLLQQKRLLNQLPSKFIVFSSVDVSISETMSMKLHPDSPTDYELPGTVSGQDIVYMATSATTGDSKIVRQKESSLLANVDDLIKHHDLVPRKKIATSLPLFHVNALHFSLFCSLLSGGHLYLFESFNPRLMFENIEKEKIQIVSLIPVLLNNILINQQSLKNYDLSSLEYFVSAAAPMSVTIVRDILNIFGKRILQGYGLSEAINFSCVLPRGLSDELYHKCMLEQSFPSIGPALEHSEIKIVNEQGIECNEEEIGELRLKGPYVMPGYLGTDIGFKDGDFLTGDLGFYKIFNEEKFYFISGRKKEIAKVSGESVSLRELDEQIKSSVEIQNDFFTTFFENIYKGEELALICSLRTGDDVDKIVDNFKNSFQKIHQSRTPKIVLFVTGPSIRTASGKARRFLFQEHFVEFKERRFFNQLLIKKV